MNANPASNSEQSVPLAIVGLACRLPGANNLEEFWRLLIEGRSVLGELPPSRLDKELLFDANRGARAKTYSSIGGICDDLPFDREKCPIPEELIKQADKAHLTLCEVAAEACRSGGLDPFHLPVRHVGVYIGHTCGTAKAGDLTYAALIEHTANYLREVPAFCGTTELTDRIINEVVQEVRQTTPKRYPDGGPNLSANMAAGLISKAFNLDGPYCTLNAACASSLEALALGARAVELGQIEMAIVGGASYCKSDSLVLFSQAQSVSATGSRPFDADADGLVTSEGFIVALIKTLERALADNDKIFAVIPSIGISSDGRGKSLWAPRKEGQIEAIHRAYGPGVDISRLQFIEAHATSTQVGDATEIGALAEALQTQLPKGKRIPIGSVKANVGHTLETAGMAGMVKAVLAIQHGMIPPQINVRQLNPKIDWDKLPFYVPMQAEAWPAPTDGHPRRAGINAFGIGGLNVHLVVDEFIPERARLLVQRYSNRTNRKQKEQQQQEPIAVVGMGAVLPATRTIESAWETFVSGNDFRSELPISRFDAKLGYDREGRKHWKSVTKLAGHISDFAYDWRKHKVPPKQIQAADPLQFMLLDAVDQAFQLSGYDKKAFDHKRTGVLVGGMFGGEFACQLQMGLKLPAVEKTLGQILLRHGFGQQQIDEICRQYEDVLLQKMPALIDETGSFTSSTLASRITKSFDLMGGAAAVDGNVTSAFAALSACIDLLRTGQCDMMVCAAGERALGLPDLEDLSLNGVLSSGELSGPFDANSDGYIPGEGVGVVLLKRLTDAQRDGDKIFGILRGLGCARGDSVAQALQTSMQRGLSEAQVDPRDVTCLECGTPGLPEVDKQELAAIAAVYGNDSREAPLMLGSPAGQLGFAASSSGMISLIKALLELEHRQTSAFVGLSQPAPYFSIHQNIVCLDSKPRPLPVTNREGRLFAAVNSFGTWNVAYHLVIEGPSRVALPTKSGNRDRAAAKMPSGQRISAPLDTKLDKSTWRILRLQAETKADLSAFVQKAALDCETYFQNALASKFHRGGYRLAIVACDSDDLSQKLQWFQANTSQFNDLTAVEDWGLFYRSPPISDPKVALLFAGQGSQFSGMLKPLVQQFAPAAQALTEIDAELSSLGFPKFAEFAWQTDALGRDAWLTQLSILAADTIIYRGLGSLGIRPDRVAGHSFGEFAALLASECWSFKTAALATHARSRAIENCCSVGYQMLSIRESFLKVKTLIADSGCDVHISHQNAPLQTVVAGDSHAIQALEERLRRAGIDAIALAVPRPFHTPLMSPSQPEFTKALSSLSLEPPKIPLLSSVTNLYVADPLHIRENLARQLVAPVNYVGLVQRLANEGVQLFIEVGPRQVLTRLHQQILANGSMIAVSSDHPKRPGVPQLLHVQAAYEVVSNIKTGAEQKTFPKNSGSILQSQSPIGRALPLKNRTSDASKLRVPPTPLAASPAAIPRDSQKQNGSGLTITKKQRVAAVPLRAAKTADRKTAIETVSAPTAEIPKLKSAIDIPQKTLLSNSKSGATNYDGLQTVIASGSALERGLVHGIARRQKIRAILRRYVNAVETNEIVHRDNLLQAIRHAEKLFDSAAMDELRGMARGAEVSEESLIAHNVRLMLDLGAGCCHFAVSADVNGSNGLLHAANEDLPLGLMTRGCLRRHIQVNRSEQGYSYATFPIAGQIGALSGINSQGVAITSAKLLDLPRIGEPCGLLHSLIVRNILTEAHDIDSAVRIAQQQPGAAAWSLCISHHPSDEIATVEYDCDKFQISKTRKSFVTSNHAVLFKSRSNVPEHSQRRFDRLVELLNAGQQQEIPIQDAKKALRDMHDSRRGQVAKHPTMNTIRRVDNQMSLVFHPGEGTAWVNTSGSEGRSAEEYHKIDLRSLLRNASATSKSFNTNGHGSRLLPAQRAVCQRFVLRTVPREQTGRSQPRFTGSAILLVHGRNPLAAAIEKRLQVQGVRSHCLSCDLTEAEFISELEHIWRSGPAHHLFLLGGADSTSFNNSLSDQWKRLRQNGVLLPFKFCQEWYRRIREGRLIEQATLMSCTRQGGDFGFSGDTQSLAESAIAALIKALDFEVSQHGKIPFRARAVDFGKGMTFDVEAQCALAELADGHQDVEVAYRQGKRFVVRPEIESMPEHLSATAGQPTGVWIVTGGARGITAIVARAIAKQYDLKLHLLGSSPFPKVEPSWRNLSAQELKEFRTQVTRDAVQRKEIPAEAWKKIEKALEIDRNLADFAADDVAATYHCCDLTDGAQVRKVVDEIRRESGPIHGILHGAGYEAASRFDKKRTDAVSLTIGAKVDGAIALLEATQADPISHFIAFSSISGRFGAMGQADYCMANEIMTKLLNVHRRLHPQCRSTTFHWHAWDDAGMAVRPESKGLLEAAQVKFMPAREGVQHVLNEIRLGLPENEVLVTDPNYCKQYYPDLELRPRMAVQQNQTTAGNPRSASALSATAFGQNHLVHSGPTNRIKVNAPQLQQTHPSLINFPLLNQLLQFQPQTSLLAEVKFDPVFDPFLAQHRFKDRPQLPAIGALEAMVQAGTLLEPGQGIGIVKDFKIKHGWRFLTDEPQTGRVEVRRESGHLVARLLSDFRNQKGMLVEKNRVHAEAVLLPGNQQPIAMSYPVPLPGQWGAVFYPSNLPIQHGPVFQGLKQISIGPSKAIAQFFNQALGGLANAKRSQNHWLLPVLVIDNAFFACGTLSWAKIPNCILLPQGIRHLHWMDLPHDHEICTATIRQHSDSPGFIEFDFAIFGADRRPLCEAIGYQCVQIKHS